MWESLINASSKQLLSAQPTKQLPPTILPLFVRCIVLSLPLEWVGPACLEGTYIHSCNLGVPGLLASSVI